MTLTFDRVPEVTQTIIPQNGGMVLGMSIGTIHEGKSGDGEKREVVDEAAVTHTITNHAKLDRDGTICDWNNTADHVTWTVEFPEGGEYEVSIITQTRWKNQPWDGGRIMEVSWNGQKLSNALNKDEQFPSPYHTKYLSYLGTLKIGAGECGQLTLKTLRIDSEDAGRLNLSSVRLMRK